MRGIFNESKMVKKIMYKTKRKKKKKKKTITARNLPHAGDKGGKLLSILKKNVTKAVNKDKKRGTLNTVYREKG